MEFRPIDIGIVDDHTLFRNGLSRLLSEFSELHILFEAGNGLEMKSHLEKHSLPEVILMDINMPLMDGFTSTHFIKTKYPEIKVLAISMFEDDQSVIKMIKSGASGYVLKESRPKEVLEAIKTIVSRGVFINEMVTGKLIRSISFAENHPTISSKESEFLKFCCSELTYKEIAGKMCVSPRTIDNYRESLFQKLNLKSRTGLVLYAVQNKLGDQLGVN
jgi:DNA-binding NarL/FixJ family response regulator